MRLLNRHRLGNVAVDAGIVAAAWYAAFFLRFDDVDIPFFYADLRNSALLWVLAVKIGVFVLAGLYTRWWRYVSLSDLRVIAQAGAVASALVTLVLLARSPLSSLGLLADVRVPASVIPIDFFVTLLGMIAVRAAARTIFERPRPGTVVARGREALVVGAGDAGQLVVREMLSKPKLGMTPIGIVDDDPRKQHMRLYGVRVVGTTSELDELLADSPPDEVVIAMPAAAGSVRQRIVDACLRHRVPVKTLPGVNELLTGDINLLTQLRAVQVEDVLGREPVKLDLPAIGGYLTGRAVLVTGAGGSIGSELVRQISRLAPAKLVLVDHGENNLFEIERWTHEQEVRNVVPIVADVKNTRRMEAILLAHRPEVVFHAAAYKHVPLMELNPTEALRNNSLATRDLAELCREHEVDRFVLVSTDKAVDASTVMGASKALCEWVIEAAAQSEGSTRFIAVRFGNVLGSSGSVVPIFRRQIAAGGPVTVTDPEMTRFFMTIPEAAQLIVQAGGVGRSGDIFVLDMGDPIRIVDLANDMVRLSGKVPDKDVEVRIVGRRPGEKLHEKLFDDDEVVERTHHEKLQRARRGQIDTAWLDYRLGQVEALLDAGETEQAVDLVLEMTREPRREPLRAATD